MDQTRREFIKDIAVTGAVVTLSDVYADKSLAEENKAEVNQTKCPFFDQPLMCEGPDNSGK